MAHELDFQKGSAAFVSYKAPAWHGLGTVIDTPMTVEQAIRYANLDFTVEKAPNQHKMPSLSGDGFDVITSNTSFFTFRTDTNHVLGDRLGKSYHVVQNDEAFGVMEELVKEGGLILESAGSLYNGCIVFMCLRLPEPIKVLGTDRVQQYVLLVSGHDGNTSILALFTNTRVVCNNTLQVALKGAVSRHSIRHTRSAMNRLNEAIQIMGLVKKNEIAVQQGYDRMAQRKMRREDFYNYIGNLFCTKDEITSLQKGEKDVISTRKQNIIDSVLDFYATGIGQDEAGRDTWWGGYNAITGFYSHKGYKNAEDRMNGLVFANEAKTMERALILADAPELIKPINAQPKLILDDRILMN